MSSGKWRPSGLGLNELITSLLPFLYLPIFFFKNIHEHVIRKAFLHHDVIIPTAYSHVFDFVSQIYPGSTPPFTVRRYCGSDWIYQVFTSSVITVDFRTDGSDTGSGFRILFSCIYLRYNATISPKYENRYVYFIETTRS